MSAPGTGRGDEPTVNAVTVLLAEQALETAKAAD